MKGTSFPLSLCAMIVFSIAFAGFAKWIDITDPGEVRKLVSG